MTDDTKTCPYCAETIQAAAVVCKHCGRDLVDKPAAPAPVNFAPVIQQYTAAGWTVQSQAADGVQLVKRKQWSKIGLILGFVLLIAYGAGLLILLLTVIDYALQKEGAVYITADDVRAGNVAPPIKSNTAMLIIGGLLVVLIIICILLL